MCVVPAIFQPKLNRTSVSQFSSIFSKQIFFSLSPGKWLNRCGSVRWTSVVGRLPPQSALSTADAPRRPVWPPTKYRVVPVHHSKPVMIIMIFIFSFSGRSNNVSLLSSGSTLLTLTMDVNEVPLFARSNSKIYVIGHSVANTYTDLYRCIHDGNNLFDAEAKIVLTHRTIFICICI